MFRARFPARLIAGIDSGYQSSAFAGCLGSMRRARAKPTDQRDLRPSVKRNTNVI
jgi:hypothetical protein